MTYETYYSGSLKIEPQLPSDGRYGVEAFNEMYEDSIFLLQQVEGEETVELRDGEIAVVGNPGHTQANMRWDDSVTTEPTTAETNARKVVEIAQKNDAIVNGIINASGEASSDIWRIRVENNEVCVEYPMLTWPNGEQERLLWGH